MLPLYYDKNIRFILRPKCYNVLAPKTTVTFTPIEFNQIGTGTDIIQDYNTAFTFTQED